MFSGTASRFSTFCIALALVSFGCSDDAVATPDECSSGHGDHDHDHEHDHDADSDGGSDEDETLLGTPTGTKCPTGSTVTWENFGEKFMNDYCTRCHSSELKCGERHDAPLEHDFDTREGVFEVANHVDRYAAAGPDAVNTIMPVDGDKPSEEERRKLAEWLACGTK